MTNPHKNGGNSVAEDSETLTFTCMQIKHMHAAN